jgi:hypothetical protein
MSRSYALVPIAGTAGVDTTARTAANDALALVKRFQPDPGAAVTAGSEAFVSGSIYTNPTSGTINLPAPLSQASMLAAGFVLVDGGVSGQNKAIFRDNTNQNVKPTPAEFANPTTKDSAYINLNGTGYEDWSFSTGSWVKIGAMIPGANKAKPIYRTSTTPDQAPSSAEFPSPKDDDAVWINLNGTGYEDWIFKAGGWSKVGGNNLSAATVSFDNSNAALPSSPNNLQLAIEDVSEQLLALSDRSIAGINVVRPDTDRLLKSVNLNGSERMTLVLANDNLLLPNGSIGQAFRVLVPIGAGTFKVGGVDYNLLSEPQILTFYWDVVLNGYRVVGIPQTVTGGTTPATPPPAPTATTATSEIVSMAALPADVWTSIPIGSTVTNPLDFTVSNSAGNLLRLPRRLSAGRWQVISSVPLSLISVLLQG